MDTKQKAITMILSGNLRIFARGDKEIRGVVDHRQATSGENELEFSIARKNSAGAWVNSNDYGFFTDVYGEVFENGYTGESADLIQQINQKIEAQKPILIVYERQKHEQNIEVSMKLLSGMMRKLKKADPDVLRGSLLRHIQKNDADSLYRKDLKYLDRISYLLTEDELAQYQDCALFFDTLDKIGESEASFELLKTLMAE